MKPRGRRPGISSLIRLFEDSGCPSARLRRARLTHLYGRKMAADMLDVDVTLGPYRFTPSRQPGDVPPTPREVFPA